MPDAPTQPAGNISTEHQEVGDARLPQDTLDRDQVPEGGLTPEEVEDRPGVGMVEPEDYPKDRADG